MTTAKKTILLVEDEALVAVAEKAALARHGYNVVLSTTGESAVTAVAENPEIDLVLMDINLGPGIDGTEAAAQILDMRDLPVVFLSSHTEPEVVERTERITSYGYIVKNSGETVLITSIRMAFRLFAEKGKVRAHDRLLSSVFNSIQEGISVLDRDFTIRHANQVLEQWYPTEGSLVGRTCFETYHWRAVPCDACPAQKCFETGRRESQIVPGRPDSPAEWLELFCYPIKDQEGRVTGVVEFARDITERLKLERKLSESEARFRNIMSSMQDVVFTMDSEKRHTGVYGSWVAQSGLTPGHFLGRTFADILGPEAAQVHEEAFDKALGGAFALYEWTVPKAEGEQFFQTSLSPIFDDSGGVTGVVGVGRDVTELHQMRRQLEAREELLNRLLHQVPGAIYQYQYYPDGSSRFPFASENIYLVYEVTPEEVRQDAAKVLARLHPEDYDRVVGSILESYETLSIWQCDYRVVLPEKGERWLRGRATPERMPDGSALWHGFITDITDLKDVAAALRKSDERWQFALEGADHGVWDWNAVTDEVFFSRGWKAMLGYGEDDISNTVQEWETRIHPEDKEHVFEVLERHLSGETPVYESEHRLLCKDGSYKWILDRGRVMSRDSEGQALRVMGTHTDVTSRKAADEEILRLIREKDALLKEVHHRIKNNFAGVESLLSLQAAEASKSETVSTLQETQARVAAMRSLYEKLLDAENYREVSTKLYLTELVESVISAYASGSEGAVNLSMDLPDIKIGTHIAFPLGAVVAELVTNSMKYAFGEPPGGSPGEKEIGVTLVAKNRKATLKVADNGGGFPRGVDPVSVEGFGLTLVRMMVEQLEGTWHIDSVPGEGTQVIVEIPV